MTISSEQLREDFDTWLEGSIYSDDSETFHTDLWNAYQAGWASLQSQKPKTNDLMLSAVIRMPFEMAMADPISRMQFYQRAQQVMNELEAIQHSCKETSQDQEDVERLDWLQERIHDSSYAIQLRLLRDPSISEGINRIEIRTRVGSGVWEQSIEGGSLREAIDHARRIEENK